MVIWIDGTYGIGKSTVALKIKENLSNANKDFIILESDEVYLNMIQENPILAFGGSLPQNNDNFISRFKKAIIENKNKNLIVVMALTQNKCKEDLFECLVNSKINIMHFILTAKEETIKFRINTDEKRERRVALEFLEFNQKFLIDNFKDAKYINTENKSVEEVAREILSYL